MNFFLCGLNNFFYIFWISGDLAFGQFQCLLRTRKEFCWKVLFAITVRSSDGTLIGVSYLDDFTSKCQGLHLIVPSSGIRRDGADPTSTLSDIKNLSERVSRLVQLSYIWDILRFIALSSKSIGGVKILTHEFLRCATESSRLVSWFELDCSRIESSVKQAPTWISLNSQVCSNKLLGFQKFNH